MAEKNNRRNKTTDALFDAILSLETREECYNFFEDLYGQRNLRYGPAAGSCKAPAGRQHL
jgi:uncharacterized protein YerC